MDLFSRTPKIEGLSANEWLEKGVSLSALGRYEEAIKSYRNAIELDPKIAAISWNNIGHSLEYLSRHEEANKAFDLAIGLDPKYSAAWYNKGNLLVNLKRYGEAIMAFDHVIEMDLKNTTAWYYKGVSLAHLKRYEEAVRNYDYAIDLDPKNAQIWKDKGDALVSLGHHRKAIKAYDKVIELDPNSAVAWYNKGVSLAQLNYYEEAVRAFDHTIEINPKSAAAWNNKGNIIHNNFKHYEEAIKAYDAAIELDPKDAVVWRNKGNSLRLLERYEEAVRAYANAINLDPKDVVVWINKGISLESLGQYEEAIRAYDRAIELDPKYAPSWNTKGSVLERLEKFDDAITAYNRAIELDPSLKKAADNKAAVLKKLQNLQSSDRKTRSAVQSPTASGPLILRESEFYGGTIRVKISVRNESPNAILDVMLDPEIDENILNFDRYEPGSYPTKAGKIVLGNIPPHSDRTISLYLEPLICAKEGTDIHCWVRYKDAAAAPKSIQMDPLKIQVICPIFETGQPVNIGQMKSLVTSLRSRDCKIYTFPTRINETEVLNACRHAALLHDIWHISTLKKASMVESWYYGKTKVSKKDLIIKIFIDRDANQLEVTVIGDDPKDITGLLAEYNRNLTEEFTKIGRLQTVYNISIKDSVVQRTNLLSYCEADGTCQANIIIQDSVVQRSNFLSPGQDNTRD